MFLVKSSFHSDEIKSVLYPPKAISSQSDFICEADLFRRKTDFASKKAPTKVDAFFWLSAT